MKYKHCVAAMTSAVLLLTGCQQTQAPTPEQSSTTTYATAPEQNSNTQITTTEQSSTTQTLTETQPPTTDNTPLTNIVRSDQIKLPDDILSFIQAERTEDGFGCIAYNEYRQLTYLHISEDMQTSETFVLTSPSDQEKYYSNRYRWFAIEEDGIWAIVNNEGHEEIEPYLLCHYAKNGELISAIPANELQDHMMSDYRHGGDFESVGDVLYLTLYDGKVLQIDKETAKVSVVSDLNKEDDSYDVKYLCFDRDDKPILLREKVEYAPDTHTIHEAAVSEFDLESGSCGQTIYTTGDNWDSKEYFFVLKGCGEYRFFINTSNELIGIRDDGTQESLIDLDASDLDRDCGTIVDCLRPPYYTSDIMIVPADDTHFLGHIIRNPDYKIAAYHLTRKHESEIS